MRFEKNQAAWNSMTRSKAGMVGVHVQKLVSRLVVLAKKQVGVDTSKLKRSIKGDISAESSGIVGKVGSDNPITLIHHEGTRPHIIVPNRQQTLRFSMRGKIVYTKLVRHPGTKPNRFLTDNLRKVIDD